ncbi:hypothetical protein F5J12DRAFT_825292 [Pisolithus orientalis]|uniref:uncharacterized protein n=1 Tax=Pisolithus orientalis TaxID=936130 RepID=UPI002224DD14|nr:uncharacterized protein F5J12DRAFT_825292 [Pisolithus orientalis]KAI6008744.1 hypothetical protein F5J12DRAFT_825292 [Pisolithus orientalis]
MLTLLGIEQFSEYALPPTYDPEKYQGGIICPQGIRSVEELADIHMCNSCRKVLTSTKPHQPKDAITNFRYTLW